MARQEASAHANGNGADECPDTDRVPIRVLEARIDDVTRAAELVADKVDQLITSERSVTRALAANTAAQADVAKRLNAVEDRCERIEQKLDLVIDVLGAPGGPLDRTKRADS